MVCVLPLKLPGRPRALVDPETAALMVQFGHARVLEDERPKAPVRDAMKCNERNEMIGSAAN